MNDTLLLIDGIKDIIKRLLPFASTNVAGNGLIDATEAINRVRIDVDHMVNTPCEDCRDKDFWIKDKENEIGNLETEAFDRNEQISELKTEVRELKEELEIAKSSDKEVPKKKV